ncbi:hypothetical protein DS742_27495 [Lacrimispora amygdalina]|uniref:Uncharacterized protein n=1 Tax=Lacrimispora amygdalina TaxID=253257 RepID=A0A3E2N483_9FIRM|nr:hypothetical protein [Clostridium indicum]RFZ75721.1 hypothetical protein DS742_27495 [Clostridium indicum]
MTRLESIEKYLRPFFYNLVRKKVMIMEQQLTDCIPKEIEAFLWAAVERQKTDTWRPAYLSVFYLHSSSLTGIYQYQVRLMNEKMYFDDSFEEFEWFASFLYGTMLEEKAVLSYELKRNFVRVKEYEINHGLRLLAKEYKKVMEVYLMKIFCYLNENPAFMELEKKEPFHFLFGDYMGEIKSILIYEGGNIHVS